MRILFAISLLAFAALAIASVLIARHIRQSRSRQSATRQERSQAAVEEVSAVRFPLSSQRSNRQNEAAAASRLHPEWAYYNKDMGDLSDPRPAGRYRIRERNR